jgi:uncharacterized protein (DUF427 family)
MVQPEYIKPDPGQESVWDYPRPPRLEPTPKPLRIIFNRQVIAETTQAYRVLETSHPPVYYIPPADICQEYLIPSTRHSQCEYKGRATYWTVQVGDRRETDVAWSYPQPYPAFAALQRYLAFYADRMDECSVDGERVIPQPGNFYGGWITADIVGPFKGPPGSWGW